MCVCRPLAARTRTAGSAFPPEVLDPSSRTSRDQLQAWPALLLSAWTGLKQNREGLGTRADTGSARRSVSPGPDPEGRPALDPGGGSALETGPAEGPLYLLASASIRSSSCSPSSSILSSFPDFLSPSPVPPGRARWCRRTLRPRPFLRCPRDEVWVAEETGTVDRPGDRDAGFDLADRLWVDVDRVGSGSTRAEEDTQTLDESGSASASPGLGGESRGRRTRVKQNPFVGQQHLSPPPLPGPLLFWNSSVIGGSASSWMVGTDASRPARRTGERTQVRGGHR